MHPRTPFPFKCAAKDDRCEARVRPAVSCAEQQNSRHSRRPPPHSLLVDADFGKISSTVYTSEGSAPSHLVFLGMVYGDAYLEPHGSTKI